MVGPVEEVEVAGGLFEQLQKDQVGQLVEGARVEGVALHRQRDALAGVRQPRLLGLIATGAGGQDQAEALLGRQAALLPGNVVRVHPFFPFSLRPFSTACSASSRLSSTSTPIARSRASARIAVSRAFSAVGRSAAPSWRSRTASSCTTSAVSIGEASASA